MVVVVVFVVAVVVRVRSCVDVQFVFMFTFMLILLLLYGCGHFVRILGERGWRPELHTGCHRILGGSVGRESQKRLCPTPHHVWEGELKVWSDTKSKHRSLG